MTIIDFARRLHGQLAGYGDNDHGEFRRSGSVPRAVASGLARAAGRRGVQGDPIATARGGLALAMLLAVLAVAPVASAQGTAKASVPAPRDVLGAASGSERPTDSAPGADRKSVV